METHIYCKLLALQEFLSQHNNCCDKQEKGSLNNPISFIFKHFCFGWMAFLSLGCMY